jgi:hypothetical protein
MVSQSMYETKEMTDKIMSMLKTAPVLETELLLFIGMIDLLSLIPNCLLPSFFIPSTLLFHAERAFYRDVL